MAQFYSEPDREDDPHALPDMEVFYMDVLDFAQAEPSTWMADVFGQIGLDGDFDALVGWYYWPCFPGCLPDGDPVGPFAAEQAAIEDARENIS